MSLRILALLLPLAFAASSRAQEVAMPALVARAELGELTRLAPWHCYNYDPITRTCAGIGQTSWDGQGTGSGMIIMLGRDRPGVLVVMSMPVHAQGDLDCIRVGEIEVEIVSLPALPKESQQQLRSGLLSAVASKREVSCAGIAREGDHFRLVTKDDDKPSGKATRLDLMPERPMLRPLGSRPRFGGRIEPLGAALP